MLDFQLARIIQSKKKAKLTRKTAVLDSLKTIKEETEINCKEKYTDSIYENTNAKESETIPSSFRSGLNDNVQVGKLRSKPDALEYHTSSVVNKLSAFD